MKEGRFSALLIGGFCLAISTIYSCSAPEQTYGDFGLANYSGRTIAVETNLISAADITADSIQFVPDFDYCDLCSTPLTDEPIPSASVGGIGRKHDGWFCKHLYYRERQ